MLKLSDFEVDEKRGFLPAQDPLQHLPPYFQPWESVMARLPALLGAPDGRLRAELEQLPLLDYNRLPDEAAYNRAMLLLAMLGHAYVWYEGGPPATRIPAGLAVPWCGVAVHLARPPVLSHASMILYNWRRLQPDGPLALNNLATLHQFYGGLDEAWFYLVTVDVEARGAPAVQCIVAAQQAVAEAHPGEAERQLNCLAFVLTQVQASLKRMYERCDPYIFYLRVRRFVGGWKGSQELPEGVIYEGVSQERQQFHGGSAAQSSLFAAIDAALGIEHLDQMSGPFLLAMRQYMPVGHRRFIQAVADGPSIRRFVFSQEGQASLRQAYNTCIVRIADIRQKHLQLAAEYIIAQTKQGEYERGTGGSGIMPFLKKCREETLAARLGE